jgi:hypothetical protein
MAETPGKVETKNEGVKDADPVVEGAVEVAAADKEKTDAAAGVSADTAAKVSDSAEDTAGDITENTDEKKDAVAELPDNKWTRQYLTFKAEVDNNPNLKGTPAANLILSFLLLAAKFGRVADAIPGRFMARVREDDVLNKKKLEDDEIAAAKLALELAPDDETRVKDASDKLKVSGFNGEKASVRFLCSTLWRTNVISDETTIDQPFDDVQDADTLAAKLLMSTRTVNDVTEPYYDTSKSLADIAKTGAKIGTVIIFSNFSLANASNLANFKDAGKVAAYSIGNGVFRYFDAKSGEVKTFNVKDPKSPMKGSSIQAIFIPTFAKDETAPSDPASDTVSPEVEIKAEDTHTGTLIGGKSIKEIADEKAKPEKSKEEDVGVLVKKQEDKRRELEDLTKDASYDAGKLVKIIAIFSSENFRPGGYQLRKEEVKAMIGTRNFKHLVIAITDNGKKEETAEWKRLLETEIVKATT